jgi:hypothetical protein
MGTVAASLWLWLPVDCFQGRSVEELCPDQGD